MKKFLSLFAILLAMSLALSSCKDDEDTTGPSDLKVGEMSATVDGKSWKGQNALFFNASGQVSGAKTDGINPTTMTTEKISVVIGNFDGIEKKSYKAICYFQITKGFGPSGSTESWNDVEGSCEITEVTDENVKGTFTFTGKNEEDGTTKKVTGSFYTPRQ